jgi:hypothetical protein
VLQAMDLPFWEWTDVIPNNRSCKVLLDQVTGRAHIMETESESRSGRRKADARRVADSPLPPLLRLLCPSICFDARSAQRKRKGTSDETWPA